MKTVEEKIKEQYPNAEYRKSGATHILEYKGMTISQSYMSKEQFYKNIQALLFKDTIQ